MTIICVLLMLASGILASKYFLRNAAFLERLGVTVFFFLIAAPFVNINCVFLFGQYISNELTILNSVFTIIFFISLFFYSKRINDFYEPQPRSFLKTDFVVLLIAVLTLIFLFYYHSNKEFLFSLAAYIKETGAECFFKQTFSTFSELNLSRIPALKIYAINCTPGNILFSSTLLPIFKFYTFKVVYLLFCFLLFIFVYLVIYKLTSRRIIAVLTAIFAIFNPYMLSVEVLDRNVMALAVSVMLFYLILEHKDKIFLHGLVFGILAGLGLRFLPLLFLSPILIMYYSHGNFSIKNLFIFLAAFIITFTFNIPHIGFNGLNGLGETQSSLSLIILMFKEWLRTPFMPFPNLIYYLLNISNYLGSFLSAIICLGAFGLWNKNKKIFLSSFCWIFMVILVLSYQRNWIQGTKYRIIIEGFLALYIFFAYGIEYLFFAKETFYKKFALSCVCLLLPLGLARLSYGLSFQEDKGFYKRNYLYQKESASYHNLQKDFLLNIGILPNYKRLYLKLDLRKKKIEEGIIFDELFPKGKLPYFDKFKSFYSDWQEYFLNNKINKNGYLGISQENYRYIKVDFEKLVKNPANAVEIAAQPDFCSIDLMRKKELSGVFYSELQVPWQNMPLPVCVMIKEEEINYLNELNIDLNLYTSFGKNKAGLYIVNSIHYKSTPDLRVSGFNTGMDSLPLFSKENSLVLRIPDNLRIVIRNWFMNESGIPYKVDSWCIEPDGKGLYKITFYYHEPESYL